MPIVFVHGVNNRDGEEYRKNEKSRNGFLREIVAPSLGLSPNDLKIFNPYWGQFGAQFAWNMAALPDSGDEFQNFGTNPESVACGQLVGLLAETNLTTGIVTYAQSDFSTAVDLLYASAMAGAESEEDARALARSYYHLSSKYAEQTPPPEWIQNANQNNFVDQLLYHAADPNEEASFGAGGILNSLKEGASRLSGIVPDVASGLVRRLARKKLNASIAQFTGDAFVYLSRRGTKEAPGDIVLTVLKDLHAAKAARVTTDDKLIVIAHSFGGEIIYDILTYFDPSIQVDYLITVGSQVGLFEEMKLYVASRDNIPPNPPTDRITQPMSINRWLNVFDTNDILSYRLEPVVDGVSDFSYDTGFSTLGAHGGYFLRPSFYKHLAARLSQK